MIKKLAVGLTLLGIIGLVLGLLGIFGKDLIPLSPWALAILGLIFFVSGIGLLNSHKDTDEV